MFKEKNGRDCTHAFARVSRRGPSLDPAKVSKRSRRFVATGVAAVVASLVAAGAGANPAVATTSYSTVDYEDGTPVMRTSTQQTTATTAMTYSPLTRSNAGDYGLTVEVDPDGSEYALPFLARAFGRDNAPWKVRLNQMPGGATEASGGNLECGQAQLGLHNLPLVIPSYTVKSRFGVPLSHDLMVRAKITSGTGSVVNSDYATFLSGDLDRSTWSDSSQLLEAPNLQIGSHLESTMSGSVVTTLGVCTIPNFAASFTLTSLPHRMAGRAP
jgi:hypothetical protein